MKSSPSGLNFNSLLFRFSDSTEIVSRTHLPSLSAVNLRKAQYLNWHTWRLSADGRLLINNHVSGGNSGLQGAVVLVLIVFSTIDQFMMGEGLIMSRGQQQACLIMIWIYVAQ